LSLCERSRNDKPAAISVRVVEHSGAGVILVSLKLPGPTCGDDNPTGAAYISSNARDQKGVSTSYTNASNAVRCWMQRSTCRKPWFFVFDIALPLGTRTDS